jgi:hypothetical protein
VVAFFVVGAIVAGFFAALIMAAIPDRLRQSARYAVALVTLVVLTTGAHVVLLFGQYVPYYAQWWPAPFHGWWLQAVTSTFAGVGFYYGAIGLPMLLPLGLPLLLASAAFLTKR